MEVEATLRLGDRACATVIVREHALVSKRPILLLLWEGYGYSVKKAEEPKQGIRVQITEH